MKIKNKNSLKLLILPVAFCSTIPFFSVVSCSSNSSIEDKLKKLLSDDNIIDLKINIDNIKSITNKEEVTISDLFTVNTNTIEIVNSNKLNDWNNNLSDEDKEIFQIIPEIQGVILPEMPTDGKVQELKVIVWVGAGPEGNKTITKTINLSNIESFNNSISTNSNNYFVPSSNDLEKNQLFKEFKSNILRYLQNQSINISDSVSTLENKLNFQFDGTPNKYVDYQDNLYCSFDSKANNGIYVNVYTNDKKLNNDELQNVTKNNIAIKLFFSFTDLLGGDE